MFEWKNSLIKIKKISVLFLIFFVIIICILTRVEYLDYNYNKGTSSDSDYLGVIDLRFLILFDQNESNSEVEILVKNMIQESYESEGFSRKYSSVISDEIFSNLNPNQTSDNQNSFDLKDIELKSVVYNNKAIVYWSKECSFDETENIVHCNLNTNNRPYTRLYLEKIDDKWKVSRYYDFA